jgi:hypothetical protein
MTKWVRCLHCHDSLVGRFLFKTKFIRLLVLEKLELLACVGRTKLVHHAFLVED